MSSAPSHKRKRAEEPDQAAMLQTNFFLPPNIQTKGFTSTFGRTENQINRARKFADDSIIRERDAQLQAKRAAERAERELMIAEELERLHEERKKKEEEEGADFAMFGGGTGEVDPGDILKEAVKAADARFLATREAEPEVVVMEELNDITKTIVIHPGSRFLRIGRATDPTPLQVPNCIYRKTTPSTSEAAATNGEASGTSKQNGDAAGVSAAETSAIDPFDEKIAACREGLRTRMRIAKLRVPPGGSTGVLNTIKNYNTGIGDKPTVILERNDPHPIDWMTDYSKDTFFVHDELDLPDDSPYNLRFPIKNRTFNTYDYDLEKEGPEAVLSDLQDIIDDGLTKLKPPVNPKALSTYSAALIIPDHSDKGYIEGMCELLLQRMGFKQIAVFQEALCATFGAGLSSACVVDIGATRTTVTCVDEGLVLNDTRHILNYGGDDITKFYTTLLQKSAFPYRDVDLARTRDWELMDRLKRDTCTLLDNLVASNVIKFHVRKQKKPTLEFSVQTYDHPVLAPSCIFDTGVIDFGIKPQVMKLKPLRPYDEESMADLKDDAETPAMDHSTFHLRPVAPPAYPDPSYNPPFGINEETGQPNPDPTGLPLPPVPMIYSPAPPPPANILESATQMPLETAVTGSLMAAENKAASLASAILVIGGTAHIQGLGAAMSWRINSIWSQRVPHFPINVEIIPPPRGLDPAAVVWRGGAVTARLEAMQDSWIKRSEWCDIKMRAYKNRVAG